MLNRWRPSIKKKISFSYDGSDYLLFQDLSGSYTLALTNGDKYITYNFKTTNLKDLIQQYPFIKDAAKHFIFDEQMDDIVNGAK